MALVAGHKKASSKLNTLKLSFDESREALDPMKSLSAQRLIRPLVLYNVLDKAFSSSREGYRVIQDNAIVFKLGLAID